MKASETRKCDRITVEKDGARVELENGLVMTVTADRLSWSMNGFLSGKVK